MYVNYYAIDDSHSKIKIQFIRRKKRFSKYNFIDYKNSQEKNSNNRSRNSTMLKWIILKIKSYYNWNIYFMP